MEHFADQHHLTGPQAVADVAAYVSQLESVPQDAIGVGSGELVTRGADVYKQACASCHGPAGEGSGQREIPQIAGQHYEYLRRQIYDAVDGRRPNFSASHIRLLARLEHDDIAGGMRFPRAHAQARRSAFIAGSGSNARRGVKVRRLRFAVDDSSGPPHQLREKSASPSIIMRTSCAREDAAIFSITRDLWISTVR